MILSIGLILTSIAQPPSSHSLQIRNTRQPEAAFRQLHRLTRRRALVRVRLSVSQDRQINDVRCVGPVSGHLGLFKGLFLDAELFLGRVRDGHEAGVHAEARLVGLRGDVVVGCAGVPYTNLLVPEHRERDTGVRNLQRRRSPGSASILTHSQPFSSNHFRPFSVKPYHSVVLPEQKHA